MLSKTHVTTGVAISVLATQPSTIPGLMCAIIGGAIGGDICDIDHNRKTLPFITEREDDEGVVASYLLATFIIAITIAIEFIGTNNFYNFCSKYISYYSIPLIIAFVLICFFGSRTSHRGFMHSIPSMLVLCSIIYFAFPPLFLPFTVGFISHIVLDLTNKRGLQLFFPFKKRICMGIFPADGTANRIIAVLSTIIVIVTVTIITIQSLLYGENSFDISQLGKYTLLFGKIKGITIYLIIINIVTFLLYSKDYVYYYYLDENDEYWFSTRLHILHGIMEILALLGGVFGQLAVFIFYKIHLGKENAYWIARIICLTIIWIGLLFLIYDPFNLS